MASSSQGSEGDGLVVLNPVSGAGDHGDEVRHRAADRGFDVRETEEAGDAVAIARDAAEAGVDLFAAAGGDGTLNEVVRGVRDAGALDHATVGVVPCGTGNDFASNVSVTGIEHAFSVLASGERRRLDLGLADDRPFLNSCVSGPTAQASAETDSEQKSRLGTVAYVLNTLRTLPTYDDVRMAVELVAEDGTTVWSGEAIAALVGNGRRFPPGGSAQGAIEDGCVDVTLVHGVGSIDLMGSAAMEHLLGRETDQTSRFQVPDVTLETESGEPISFSLDGEIVETNELSVTTDPGAVSVPVGDEYDPDPETIAED